MKEKQMLNGIDEICRFIDRESVTVMDWKKYFQFPMERDKSAIWQADPTAIMAWFKQRNCSPRTVTTEKLERYERLKRQAAGKGKKHKKVLRGLHEIADFLGIRDTAKINDWFLFYTDCPIERGENLQPTVDADALLQWLAKVELKTGKAL